MQATQSATAIREAINRSNGILAKDEDNVCAADSATRYDCFFKNHF